MIEVTIGMGVIGTTCAALLTGITTGFFSMRMARENLRATQIILEKVETIRLYSWDQINTAGFIPATFTQVYDPTRPNAAGLTYNGTMTITTPAISNSYKDDLRMLTVNLSWTTGSIPRTRQFSTFIARDGLQNYTY
jgi:type II secretory pathway pseudopilin PulG